MKIAIYPGSFDPVTLGHLNIIKRAAACFDRLIVCVMINSKKQGMFTPEERVELLKKATARFPNVEVDYSDGLLAAYAKRRRAHVVVKGLRAVSDFEQEVQMAVINRKLNPGLETMFLASSEKYTYLSSTIVKEMARYGADLADFVPREIVDAVLNVLLIVGFAAIFKASLEYTVTNHRFVSAVLHYPNSVKYAVVPLSMALMVIKSLERTILDFKKLMKNG